MDNMLTQSSQGDPALATVGAFLHRSSFFLFPIAYVVQNPSLAAYNEVQSGLKIYHIFAALLFLVSAYRASFRALAVFLVFVSIATFGNVYNQIPEITVRFMNAVGFAMVFLAAAGATPEDRDAAKLGAAVAAVLLMLTTLWQLPVIISTAATNVEGRALFPTLMAGGINIQASTIIILCLFWIGFSGLVLTGLLVLVYFLTQSRSIFLAVPAVFLDALGRRYQRGQGLRNSVIGIVGIFGAVCVLYFEIIDLDKLVNRFYSVFSGDAGTEGRSLLYSIAFRSSECYVFGCGFGSASYLIDDANYFELFEDNFHNVYLQFLVESGVSGLLVYLYMLVSSYIGARNRLADSGLSISIICVGVMGLVEFNGLEFLTAFLIGMGFSRGRYSA